MDKKPLQKHSNTKLHCIKKVFKSKGLKVLGLLKCMSTRRRVRVIQHREFTDFLIHIQTKGMNCHRGIVDPLAIQMFACTFIYYHPGRKHWHPHNVDNCGSLFQYEHSASNISFPTHPISSSSIGPSPSPNLA